MPGGVGGLAFMTTLRCVRVSVAASTVKTTPVPGPAGDSRCLSMKRSSSKGSSQNVRRSKRRLRLKHQRRPARHRATRMNSTARIMLLSIYMNTRRSRAAFAAATSQSHLCLTRRARNPRTRDSTAGLHLMQSKPDRRVTRERGRPGGSHRNYPNPNPAKSRVIRFSKSDGLPAASGRLPKHG